MKILITFQVFFQSYKNGFHFSTYSELVLCSKSTDQTLRVTECIEIGWLYKITKKQQFLRVFEEILKSWF